MEPKNIKQLMTQGEWRSPFSPTIREEGIVHSSLRIEVNRQNPCANALGIIRTNTIANAAAIVSAVNNTWALGYDPAKVDAMYKMLQRWPDDLRLDQDEREEIKSLLTSAKL